MDFLNKINDWFETFRHAEGSLDFLWTFKVPKYAIIVDAKAGLLNRAIQIVLFVFVIVLPMSRGTGLEAIVPPLNQKLHIWLTGGDYDSEAGSGDANWYCDNPATDYYYSASFDYTNNKCRHPDFYADVSSKTPSGDFVFFNTYTEEVVDGPGGETTERFFVTDVEKLKLNFYYVYDFAPRDQDKSLGYQSFGGRTDSKHQGPEHFQPVIRIFPSTDPQKPDENVAYPLRTARDQDVIYEEEKGVDSHMTLAQILNYANVSLDEPWDLEKDDQDRSPLLRTTGVDIQMQVFVHARRWGVGNDRGPIYVDISFTYFPGWTSQGWVTMGRDDGVTTRQYQYGVGLTIKTEGEFTVFDPMVMIMYFVIQGAILGLASMVVLYAIGFCFAQKSLYLESYKDKVRPTASAAHFLMQALSAERIFRDVDESGNGTVSPKELISFFRKHIGHGKVVADSVLAEVITDLFKESSVFQSKRFNDGDADAVDNDSLSLKEFLAVFCGGSNLGEAMYCMDLDARHKKKGKNGGGDLKGTLKGSSVTLDLPGSDRARRASSRASPPCPTWARSEGAPAHARDPRHLPCPNCAENADEISLGKIMNGWTRRSHARERALERPVVERRRVERRVGVEVEREMGRVEHAHVGEAPLLALVDRPRRRLVLRREAGERLARVADDGVRRAASFVPSRTAPQRCRAPPSFAPRELASPRGRKRRA